jgi:hypothetical protein
MQRLLQCFHPLRQRADFLQQLDQDWLEHCR